MQIIGVGGGSGGTLTLGLGSDMKLHEIERTGNGFHNLEFNDNGDLVPASNKKSTKSSNSFDIKREYVRKDNNSKYVFEVHYDKHERFESWIKIYKVDSETISFNEFFEVLLAEGPELFDLLKSISHESHDLFRRYTKFIQNVYTDEDSNPHLSVFMDLSNSPYEFNSTYRELNFVINTNTKEIALFVKEDTQISLLAFEEYLLRLEKWMNSILGDSFFKDFHNKILEEVDNNQPFDIIEDKNNKPITFDNSNNTPSSSSGSASNENQMLLNFIQDHSSSEDDPLGALKSIYGKKELDKMLGGDSDLLSKALTEVDEEEEEIPSDDGEYVEKYEELGLDYDSSYISMDEYEDSDQVFWPIYTEVFDSIFQQLYIMFNSNCNSIEIGIHQGSKKFLDNMNSYKEINNFMYIPIYHIIVTKLNSFKEFLKKLIELTNKIDNMKKLDRVYTFECSHEDLRFDISINTDNFKLAESGKDFDNSSNIMSFANVDYDGGIISIPIHDKHFDIKTFANNLKTTCLCIFNMLINYAYNGIIKLEGY